MPTDANSWRQKMRVQRLDVIAALAGLVGGGAAAAVLLLVGRSIGLALALALSSGLYLFWRVRRIDRSISMPSQEEHAAWTATPFRRGLPWNAVINSIFVSLLAISMLSYLNTLNTRPLEFFFSVALMTFVVAIEVIRVRSSGGNIPVYSVLVKILLISVLLRWSEVFRLPDLVGWDISYHRYYIDRVLAPQGNVVYNSYIMIDYSKFPLYHLLVISVESIASLQFRSAVVGTVGLLEALAPLFVYLIAREMIGKRGSLLAALLLAVGNQHIFWGSMFMTPMALALGLYPLFLFFIFVRFFSETAARQRRAVGPIRANMDIAMILMIIAVVLLSHILATWIYLVTLGVLWVFCRVGGEKSWGARLLTLLIVLATCAFGYWMFATDFFRYQVVFMERILSQASLLRMYAGEASVALSTGLQYELDNLGMYLLYAIGWLGVLNWLSSSRLRSSLTKLIAIIGILLLLSHAFPILFGSRAILPERWAAFLYVVMVVPAGSQLSRLAPASKTKAISIGLSLGVLAFFMMTSSTANMETPIYQPERVAFWGYRQSDIYAANLVAQSPLQIATDNFLSLNLMKYTLLKETSILMLDDVKQLPAVKEAVLLRTGVNLEIPDRPTALFSISYVMKLNESAQMRMASSRNLLLSTGDVFLYGPRT